MELQLSLLVLGVKWAEWMINISPAGQERDSSVLWQPKHQLNVSSLEGQCFSLIILIIISHWSWLSSDPAVKSLERKRWRWNFPMNNVWLATTANTPIANCKAAGSALAWLVLLQFCKQFYVGRQDWTDLWRNRPGGRGGSGSGPATLRAGLTTPEEWSEGWVGWLMQG